MSVNYSAPGPPCWECLEHASQGAGSWSRARLCQSIVLLTVAIANRAPVTLNALPADIAAFADFNHALSLPLYLVIFGSIIVGLMIGFVWDWFREHRIRATARCRRRRWGP